SPSFSPADGIISTSADGSAAGGAAVDESPDERRRPLGWIGRGPRRPRRHGERPRAHEDLSGPRRSSVTSQPVEPDGRAPWPVPATATAKSGGLAVRAAVAEGVSTVLRVSDLSVRFGSRVVVEGVDLSVGRGEVVGLIGANGAGKSTTMNAI